MVIIDVPTDDSSCNAKKDAASKRSSSTNPGTANKKSKTSNAANSLSDPVRIVASITPNKSPRDPNDYRIIKLSNGLTVALISRKCPVPNFGLGPMSSSTSNCGTSSIWPHFRDTCPQCHYIAPVSLGFSECKPDASCKADTTILQRTCDIPKSHTSVAIVVNVGGFNDPLNYQGLAHFTEHMVHYGAKRFPQVDAVNKMVANFGTYNATTRQHTTSYYNEVPDMLLEKNLELFADMLTQPLFRLDVLNREVNAVDNEFYLRLPGWRKFYLVSHVSIESKEHPLNRFICGSLETLGEGKNGDKVQMAMQENHAKHYVASAMTLSINSTKSLEELENLAIRHFSNLLQGDRSTFTNNQEEKQPKLEFQESQHVYLQGLCSRKELSMVWYLPPSLGLNDAEERVLPFITQMLADTGRYSLDYSLRSQELIYALLPLLPSSNRYSTMLEIHFSLTEKGSQNTELVVQTTFEYLRFLQDPKLEPSMKRLFDEMRILNLKEYHYGSQMTSLETTKDFAMRLQYIDDMSDMLTCESWRNARFNHKSVLNALALLTEESVTLVETLAKGVRLEDKGKVQIAPYSGARYVTMPRKKGKCQGKGYTDPGLAVARQPTRFDFSQENKYLALDIQAMSSRNVSAGGSGDCKAGYVLRCPENCGDINKQRLSWRSRHDPSYDNAIPKISGLHNGHSSTSYDPFYSTVKIHFISSDTQTSSSMSRALSWLWAHCLVQSLAPTWSQFTAAGFQIGIQPGSGMSISVSGFPRHIEEVVNTIVSHMFAPITPTIFYLAKQQLTCVWEYYLGESDMLTQTLINCTRFEQNDMSIDFLGTLEQLTLRNVQLSIRSFQNTSFAFVELFGNVPVKAFETVASHLDKMPFAPIFDNNPNLYAHHFLPVHPHFYLPGETCIRVKNMVSTTYTTSVSNVYVLGPYGTDQHGADCFSAAMFFMNCQAFMDLRTEQQLGYHVCARKMNNHRVRVPVMMFVVSVTATASKYTPCELNQKIDQFLAEYGEQLESMPQDLYDTMLNLTGTPACVKKEDVAKWYKERFNAEFGKMDWTSIRWKCLRKGIKKQSIQILSGNEDAQQKVCNCAICGTIGKEDWVPGNNFKSQFLFARGNGLSQKYFVTSPKF